MTTFRDQLLKWCKLRSSTLRARLIYPWHLCSCFVINRGTYLIPKINYISHSLTWILYWIYLGGYVSSNHPYRFWYPSQFINMLMGEVDKPLHKQSNRGSYPTGHTSHKGYSMGRWMKTGVISSPALDGVWCTIRSNHLYMCWHPSPFISRCMGGVDKLLYNQSSKGVTSILATQHSKDGPLRMKENWHTSLLLSWLVCDVKLTPIIHLGIGIHLNLFMDAWVRLIHHCTIIKNGDHIHTDHTTPQGWTSMEERKLAHF